MKVVYLEKSQIEKEMAKVFIEKVKENPKCVLGLATGSSPLGIYKNIIEAVKNGEVSFKDVTTFNLDEYLGLDGDHDQSYRYFMNHNLFNHIDINKENTHVPSGFVKDDSEAAEYDAMILAAGGIDIQLLGLGSDGHIAFNEPGTPFDSLTHITKLTEQTISDNARFFEHVEDVPKKACTMGLKSIMNAKKIVLIATGKSKALAVNELINGEISDAWPCTILRNHPNVIIYVDSELEPNNL
jgi:glucosamine-6-phosphate deaminase